MVLSGNELSPSTYERGSTSVDDAESFVAPNRSVARSPERRAPQSHAFQI